MNDLEAFGGIVLGVLISIVLPPLSHYVKSMFKPTAAGIDLKPYLALGFFSLATGLLVLVVYRLAHPDGKISFYLAVAAGYGWEATLEKLAIS